MAHVCITGNEQSPEALEQRIARVLSANPRVLCELRLDFLDLTPAAAFAFLARISPAYAPRLVITNRLAISGELGGGRCQWGILAWQSWWKDVLTLRPWFACDLDWVVLDRLAQETLSWGPLRGRAKHLILSLHGEVSELEGQLKGMTAQASELGAGLKLAAPVKQLRDLERLLLLGESLDAQVPFRSLIAMGETGRFLRWSPVAGDLTYFAVESAKATAPGQDTFADVLPYLRDKRRPDLYVLLGDNPENRRGEDRWNKVFLRRGAKARYVNLPLPSEQESPDLGARIEFVLRRAQVRGASVTKPFKMLFGKPVNTLAFDANDGRREENTDGSAVLRLCLQNGAYPPSKVVVAGGGGAARSVESVLKANGYQVELWIRQSGRLGKCPEGDIFISTWPGQFQEELVSQLSGRFHLVIDAQFLRSEDSPLQVWAKSHQVPYISGATWWREQARDQDRFWFGSSRICESLSSLASLIPHSKSQTIRALALALATGRNTVIKNPGESKDTAVFLKVCEDLGCHVDVLPGLWRIYPPRQFSKIPSSLAVGEGATGFRFLCFLSTLFPLGREWQIVLEKSLAQRPHSELLSAFPGSQWRGDVFQLPLGLPLPVEIDRGLSSQYASGWLISALGMLYRNPTLSHLKVRMRGERRSEPYWKMTLSMVEACGGVLKEEGDEWVLRLGESKDQLEFEPEMDPSSLAYLEVWLRHWGLNSLFPPESREGDGAFPAFCDLIDDGRPVSLGDNPDLAPPLWAYAAIKRKPFKVLDCPQLRWKESDRTKGLVNGARRLGVPGEESTDGFVVDFSQFRWPAQMVYLATEGDHRMSMAFGLLSSFCTNIAPDRKDCVEKSFPEFWTVLEQLEGLLPS